MSIIEKMNQQIEEIEFLIDPELKEAQQPLKLVEMPPLQQPPQKSDSLPLTAEQGEKILWLLQALPEQAAQEIVTQTEPLRQRLGKATDHALVTRKAMESLAALVEQLRAGTAESRAAAAQMTAAAKGVRREVERSMQQVATQMAQAVANERAAIRRDLSQIPTVRKYFVMCLLAMLLTSAISAGIFGLAWQKSRPDPMMIKAAETFHSIWYRATDQEKRQIEKIIVRQIPSQQALIPPAKKR